jgi:Ca2+-transporting ATPase
MVAMYDPPREEVKKIIEICHTAHINVIMITGDHPLTARAIGTYLNICNANDEVLTGHDLELLTFHELKEKVKTVKIFARVSPSDKINIVKALKANGKVVAMTGDGVNDSPSLKLADVGVAMGITGTDVAKDAANIILLDDNFSTIAVAIKEGRRIFSNIQKVIAFLVAGNIAEILIILVATLFTNQFHPLPLTAILILFVNLLTDTIPGIALGLDRASPNIMTYRPVGNKQFFNRRTIFNMLYYGALLALIVLGIYLIGKYSLHIEDPKVLVALSFATVSITEMGLILCFKSSTISIFSPRLKYNP